MLLKSVRTATAEFNHVNARWVNSCNSGDKSSEFRLCWSDGNLTVTLAHCLLFHILALRRIHVIYTDVTSRAAASTAHLRQQIASHTRRSHMRAKNSNECD